LMGGRERRRIYVCITLLLLSVLAAPQRALAPSAPARLSAELACNGTCRSRRYKRPLLAASMATLHLPPYAT
jgi:hypothetical protein